MDRPLRIAIFVGCFPVVSETYILQQIIGLLKLGHEVDIYADVPADPDALVQPEVAACHLLERTTFINMPPESAPWEMPVWPITEHTWLPAEIQSTPNWQRLVRALPVIAGSMMRTPRLTVQALRQSRYGYQAASLSALYRVARLNTIRKRYDVLHAHFGPVGNSYRFAKQLWRAPLMVGFHGYDFSKVPRKSGSAVYQQLFRDSDLTTVNCDYMNRKLEGLNCPPTTVRKLSYGIDVTRFTFREKTFPKGGPCRLLTVGRLTEKKGIEYAIRAFAKVKRAHPQIIYDIIGDGLLRSKLETLIAQLGLNGCVTLHGAGTEDTVRDMLSQSHIYVLTSVTAGDGDQEGTPVSLLEAQASGLPVLSTWHSGIPEIVRDGHTGFLLPERDIEGLAERLSFLIQHPEKCVELGQNGRQFITKEFDSSRQLGKLVELYQSLIQS